MCDDTVCACEDEGGRVVSNQTLGCCDDTVCVCEDEGGRVVSNQTLGCVMIQCVYVKMKGEGL